MSIEAGLEGIFWGGAISRKEGELGGVQLLLEDRLKKAKFMLDCGQRPDHWNKFFGFPFGPKNFNALALSERYELYKGLSSVYRQDFLRHMGIEQELDTDLEMLITHPHFDHMGGLKYVDPRIKTHLHERGMTVAYLWQQLTGGTINQFVDTYDPFTQTLTKDGRHTWLKGHKTLVGRNMNVFADHESFKIGEMTVHTYPVDHSLPGSCAFILETSAGQVGISGDIRFRGRDRELTMKYIDDLVDNADYAFWEGSLFHFDHNGTEDDVAMTMAELCNQSKWAGYMAPPRDMSRLLSMYKAAKATNRILCIAPDQMKYLQAFNGQMGLPKYDDPNIAVLLLPKHKALLDRPGFTMKQMEREYFTGERQYVSWQKWDEAGPKKKPDPDQIDLFDLDDNDQGRKKKIRQRVTLEDIRKYPERFLVSVPAARLDDVLEYTAPPERSILIRSHPPPWTPGMIEDETRVMSKIETYRLNKHIRCIDYLNPEKQVNIPTVHVTGHFNKEEMRYVMDRHRSGKARGGRGSVIIPYHCMDPRYFTNDLAVGLETIVPEYAKPFRLAA